MKPAPRVALLLVADPALARELAQKAAAHPDSGSAAQPLASLEEVRAWLDRALHRRSVAETAILENPLLQALLQPAAAATLSEEDFGEALRHELNNPLTGILGNAELLLARRNQLPPGAAARVESIADQALRLREAVRRLSLKLTPGAAMKAGS
jgi:signal transduction histidine kinase